MEIHQLLTLGIAAFVAVIALFQWLTARQQWCTANDRVVLDLFQKRYEFYTYAREVAGAVFSSGRAEPETIAKAANAKEKARFLFGRDVATYLDQLGTDLVMLDSLERELKVPETDSTANIAKQRAIKDRVTSFHTSAVPLFEPYMLFDRTIQSGWWRRVRKMLGR